MSARSSTNYKSHEEQFISFIRRCITSAGGTLKLQHITGYVSQLKPEVREAIGTTTIDFKRIFAKHKDIFSFNDSTVSFRDSSVCDESEYDSDASNIESREKLPLKIVEGKGVIVKLSSDYGFIKSKEPVKTEIYFNASSLGQKGIDLTSVLFTGNIVFFNAKKNDNRASGKCKYGATKVWRADGSTPQDGQIVPKPRKTRETGLYDPLTLDGEGIIQNVFTNLGFIAVDGNDKNTVFFYKNRLANYENLVDLTQVLSRGDPVEFNAHRTTKEDAKARWEATKVWKKSGKTKQKVYKPESREDKKIFESTLLKQSKMKIKSNAKEMIRGQKGKICPRTHGAVIKFNNELADGDSALYYISGAQVIDIGWEFSEGDDVFFDAVKIKSPPWWKAVLVWSGEKPDVVLPTCVGDFSEFTDEENEVASPIPISNLSSKSTSSNSSLKSVSIKSESDSFKSKDDVKVTSSLKSVSVKSESNSFKGEDDVKVASSKLKDSIIEQKELDKKWTELSSKVCSPVRLPSFNEPRRLKKESKDEYSPVVELEKHTYTNWADSPYLEDIDNEDILASEGDKLDSRSVVTADSDSNDIPRAEMKNISKHVNSTEVNSKKNKSEFLDLSNMKSKVNKSETRQWKQKVNAEGDMNAKKLSKTKKEVDQPETHELKETASVKTFKNITGNISKVYSKFAEVVTTHSQKTVSFFWNDFYLNGLSVEELELDDLKQVLRVGDAVKFNYFIIVDDSGKTWQKVSLAWVDSKPRVPFEMSPKDFIEQNNLSVTIDEEDKIPEERISTKKFLTVLSDDDLDQDDRISQTESGFEEGVSSTSVGYSNEHNDTLYKVDNNHLSKEDIKDISNLACQDDKLSEIESGSEDCYFLAPIKHSKLHKDIQLESSTVDISSLSSTIIHLLKKDLFSSSSKVCI